MKHAALTADEVRIAQALPVHKTDKLIAVALRKTENQVHSALARTSRKLGTHGKVELIFKLVAIGVIPCPCGMSGDEK